MNLKKIFRKISLSFFGGAISAIGMVICIPVIAKSGGAEAVFFYGLLLTFIAFVSVVDAGAVQLIIHTYSNGHLTVKIKALSTIIQRVLILYLAASGLILFLFVTINFGLYDFKKFEYTNFFEWIPVFVLLTITAIGKSIEQTYRALLIALSKVPLTEAVSAIVNIQRWAGLIALDHYFDIGISEIFLWLMFCQILALAYFYLLIDRIHNDYKIRYKWLISFLKKERKFYIQVTINQLLKIIHTQSDRVIMLSFIGIAGFTGFTAIQSIPLFFIAITQLISTALYPLAINTKTSNPDYFKKIVYTATLVIVVIGSGAALIIISMEKLFFESYFSNILDNSWSTAFQVLIFALPFQICNAFLIYILNVTRSYKRIGRFWIISILISFATISSAYQLFGEKAVYFAIFMNSVIQFIILCATFSRESSNWQRS